jgi:hypothetical protein
MLLKYYLTRGSYQRVLPEGLTRGSYQRVLPEGLTRGSYQRVLPEGLTRGSFQAVLPDGLTRLSYLIVYIRWSLLTLRCPKVTSKSVNNHLVNIISLPWKGVGAKCNHKIIGMCARVRANLDLDVRGACVWRKKRSQPTLWCLLLFLFNIMKDSWHIGYGVDLVRILPLTVPFWFNNEIN